MSSRRKVQFKVDNIVMVEEPRDLTLDEIDRMKSIVAQECECMLEDVCVEFVDAEIELSEDIDVAPEGLVYWRSLLMKPAIGVSCLLEEGSDEYLDAISNGTIEEYLIFYTN